MLHAKKSILAVVAISLPLAVSICDAHDNHSESNHEFFVYDEANRIIEGKILEEPRAYCGDVATDGQSVWLTWLDFVPGQGDHLWIGRRRDGEWMFRQRLTAEPSAFANPTLTFSGQRLWLSYESKDGDDWDVLAAHMDQANKRLGEVLTISDSSGADINHRASPSGDGGLWITWQQEQAGQFDIAAIRLPGELATDRRAGRLRQQISDTPTNDWRPDIVSNENMTCVVWDGYDGDSYNVYLREFRNGRWSPVRAVADTSALEARPQAAVDAQGRVWLLWEEGGENSGAEFRGGLHHRSRRPELHQPDLPIVAQTDARGPLHRFRQLQLAVLDPSGQLHAVREPLPAPSMDLARARKDAPRGIERTGAFYERARLTVDNEGRVWVVYRHFYAPSLGCIWEGKHRAYSYRGWWRVFARALTDAGWSPLLAMNVQQGDGMQRLELTPHNSGLVAVWTTGRADRRLSVAERQRQFNKWELPDALRPTGGDEDPISGIAEASLEISGAAPTAEQIGDVRTLPQISAGTSTGSPAAGQRDARFMTRTVEGEWQVAFGDLHRHTDMSLCYLPFDGTIEDAYRYASDAAGLQFLAITDHARDLTWGDPMAHTWWRCRKEVTRHQLQDRFVPFFAYERSRLETDHNVISLDEDVLDSPNYPHAEFWPGLSDRTIMIPHANFARVVWDAQDDRRRPLMEIYQGMRNVISEDIAHDGLGRGYHIGFVASSDHISTSSAFAAAWTRELTRDSIFEAFKARRTYGATTKISFWVRAGEHWMGQKVDAQRLPPLKIHAHGSAPIRLVEVVVDGKVARSYTPNTIRVELEHDLGLTDKHYVYVRLTQADGHQAWASPIWLTGDPAE